MAVGKSSIARAASAKKAAEAEVKQELTADAPAAEPKKMAKKPAAVRPAGKPETGAAAGKTKAAAKRPAEKRGSVIYSVGQALPVYLL